MADQASKPPGARSPWYKSCLAQAVIADLPLLVAIRGFFLEKSWLGWAGLIGFGLYLGAGAVYGVVMGVYLPVYTVQKWKELPWPGKILFSLCSLFVWMCLGGIVIAWLARSRP